MGKIPTANTETVSDAGDSGGLRQVLDSTIDGGASEPPPSFVESKVCPEDTVKTEFVKNLICHFDELVVDFLDKSAREAILQQDNITDEKEFTRIKVAIESRVLQLLNDCNLSTLPVVGFFRQLCGVLSNRYPYMFLEDPKVTIQGITIRRFIGKGTGGLTGISSLPKAMQQKFAKMLENKKGTVKQKRTRDLPDDDSEHPLPKKKKKVYGVVSENYYTKESENFETFLREVHFPNTVHEREAMYSEHRKDVQHCLSTSQDMFSAVPGFFGSVLHAETHFKWLTGKSLAENIDAELPRQVRLVKYVVESMCATREFRLKLELAKIKGAEQNGSFVPEFICHLRQLNVEWHKTPGGLFRYPSEPEDDSPNILCCDGAGSVSFDLHVEKKKIFTGLNFNEVLRAFFAVSFIGNLHYPELGEAVAILLQRKVACINAEGMYCNMKRFFGKLKLPLVISSPYLDNIIFVYKIPVDNTFCWYTAHGDI